MKKKNQKLSYSWSWREPGHGHVTPETALKRAIRQVLACRGWFAFPILQGMGAYKGISDIIALRKGKVLFIEVKSKNGRQSEHQKEFERRVINSGGEYMLIRDIDEFIARLDRLNLKD